MYLVSEPSTWPNIQTSLKLSGFHSVLMTNPMKCEQYCHHFVRCENHVLESWFINLRFCQGPWPIAFFIVKNPSSQSWPYV